MIQYTKKISALLIGLALVIPGSFAQAAESVDPAFNPGMLISDEAFSDTETFGSAAGIQSFLELKKSPLANTSPSFLVKLKEPDTLTKVGLEDPQPNLTRLRTAAELIYDAGSKWGLNPQVILVLLQKEQSLINGSFDDARLQRALDRAVGFGCPDYEGCGDIFLGFYKQIFGSFDSENNRWLGASASLMKSFRTEVNGVRVGRGPGVDSSGRTFGRPIVKTSRKGDRITLDNTMGGYKGIDDTQTVTMENFATPALYRYTPHVFNGNYNFWKFYTTWFKYPNGTVIKKKGDNNQYVIYNGTKRPFSDFVASQRKIKIDNVITVSKSEFESYVTEKPLPPLDGTLIKGDTDPAIFYIDDSSKHAVSSQVFIQRKFSSANVVTLPQAEVDSYAVGKPLAPLDGTLIIGTTTGTVYIIDTGYKRPISGAVFAARKLSFAKVIRLTDAEILDLPTGAFLTPPEQVAIKTQNDPTIYWYRDNVKRPVSSYVYVQRGVNTFPHIVLTDEEMSSIATGTPFPPRDGTVLKGDLSSGIYKMENGLKRMFSASGYAKARYPKPVILPQGDVDSYAAGEIIN